MQPLPIDALIPEIHASVKEHSALVLRAATGAGKTTRVPPALLHDSPGLVILVEPRRVAVRAAARRMAFESGTNVGDLFGYQVRFERVRSARTKCLTVTPGILLRMIQEDSFLEQVGTIIFDEFHERSLEYDLSLGIVKLLRQTVRSELRVVVMSATIDTSAISQYLGDCHTITSDGRTFPVEIRYRPRRQGASLEDAMVNALEEATLTDGGDVLMFLPGVREIHRVMDRLSTRHQSEELILPLHGELSPEEQDRVFRPTSQRKIIVSTNVAEASLTVDGVTIVIDSGLARVQQYDASVRMDRLTLQPIARASADQRAGRAGRTRPGVCIRLWEEQNHRARPEQQEPEIRRVDCAPALLLLLSIGESDLSRFDWLDAPKPESIERATEFFTHFRLWDGQALTDHGQRLAQLPVHPRIGRLLIAGQELGVLEEAALATALLSDRDPFTSDTRQRVPACDSDLWERVVAMQDHERTGRCDFAIGTLHRGGAANTVRAATQLARILGGPSHRAAEPDRAFRQALFTAYSDRLGKRRAVGDSRGVLVGGRGVRFAPSSGVTAELFVAVDVDAGTNESLIRSASAVARDNLPTESITTSHELNFDEEQAKVVAKKCVRFHDLMLEESPGHLPSTCEEEITSLLCEAALRRLPEVIPSPESAAGQLLLRLQCLQSWRPDFDLPKFESTAFHDWLAELCRGRKSFAELRAAPWHDLLGGLFSYDQRQRLEREAPSHITVPTGSEIELTYERDRPPVLAVRIQELFGMLETPTIAGGKVRVLLHLLAPNYRPQQVTDDLASFWDNGYPIIRKELRGRYPKHSWPDNPREAEAIRGPKKRPI